MNPSWFVWKGIPLSKPDGDVFKIKDDDDDDEHEIHSLNLYEEKK